MADKPQNERPVDWYADLNGVDAFSTESLSIYQENSLSEPKFTELITKALNSAHSISIANPLLAPYGIASQDILSHFEGLSRGENKLVYGENVSQVVHFVASGSVDAAFIPLSMIEAVQKGVIIKLPTSFHKAIEQQMILVTDSPEAREFYEFILSAKGRHIIQSNGYELPND